MTTSLANVVLMTLVLFQTGEAFMPDLNGKVRGHDYISLSAMREVGFCSEIHEDYILEIRKANRMVDLTNFFSEAAHCDNENLLECSTRVVDYTHRIIPLVAELDDLYSNATDLVRMHSSLSANGKIKSVELYNAHKKHRVKLYETLAKMVGSTFHTIQDFYSHSNFVDKDMAGIALELVTFDSVITDHNQTAKYCPVDPSVVDPTVDGYTSGYFTLKNYVRQVFPDGKCIHGDEDDGINKDKPVKAGYELALKRATSATVEYLKNTLNSLGSSSRQGIFKGCLEFPPLKDSETMGVAIDVSGSMANDITGVKNWIINFVLSGAVTFGKYIMVLFNDPDVDEPTTFYQTTDFLTAINNITVGGGGDCPEYMYTGIEKLAKVTDVGSSIYVFTDADAKDLAEKRDQVRALILDKGLKMNFILTENCAFYYRRRRRRSISNYTLTGQTSTRQDVEDLAYISGGVVVDSPRGEVDTSLEIARRLQKDADRMNLIKVDTTPSDCATTVFQVLERECNVSIVLRHNLYSNMTTAIYSPSGVVVEPVVFFRTMKTTLIVLEKVVQSGDWRMQTCYSSTYEIYSTEKVQLNAEILEVVSGVYEDVLVAIETSPLIGRLYNFTVQLEAPGMVGRWEDSQFILSLVDAYGAAISGTDIFHYKFSNGGIAGVKMFTGTIRVPSIPFLWGLTGKTTDGLIFQRQSKKFTPGWVRILSKAPIIEIRGNSSATTLQFSIENRASTSYDVNLKVSIPKGEDFFQSVTLPGEQNSTTMHLPANSFVDVNVTVTQSADDEPAECSNKYTDTETCEVALIAASALPSFTISSKVEVVTPCTATTSIPKGCLFTEQVATCDEDNLRDFNITIIQTPDSGGVPCPTQLSGKRPCRIVASEPELPSTTLSPLQPTTITSSPPRNRASSLKVGIGATLVIFFCLLVGQRLS